MATDPADPPSGRGSKYRFLVTPKWIGFHLLVVVLVVAMINLAFWQLRRLDERRQFNSAVREPTPTNRSHRSTSWVRRRPIRRQSSGAELRVDRHAMSPTSSSSS